MLGRRCRKGGSKTADCTSTEFYAKLARYVERCDDELRVSRRKYENITGVVLHAHNTANVKFGDFVDRFGQARSLSRFAQRHAKNRENQR